MPKLIQTTGDRGLDRELDDLRREIAALRVAPAVNAPPSAVSVPARIQLPTLIDDLDDVNAAAPVSGDALTWDGSQWSNNQISAGNGNEAIVSGGDTTISSRWSRKFL